MDLKQKVAFLGCGRMAEALIKMLASERNNALSQIIATHHDTETCKKLEKELRIRVISSNAEAVACSEIIVLCMRPQQASYLISEISAGINNRHIVISIAVGIPLDWLREELPGAGAIFHIHPPSTAFADSKGISFVASETSTSAETSLIAENLFRSFGETVYVPETNMDKYAIFAGCSPAFIARMAGEWFDLAIEHGIPKEISDRIILVTFQSVTNGLCNLEMSLQDFEHKIATPNGVTEMGLRVIEHHGLRKIFIEIVNTAKNKINKIRNIFNLMEQE